MSKLKTPFRYDFVGSFLRPEELKKAKHIIKKENHKRRIDHMINEALQK